MAGLARRRPLRSRKVWTAAESGSRPARPNGEIWRHLREACRGRAAGQCQAGIPDVCTRYGSHAHHLKLRAQGGDDDLDNLAWLCGNCHGYVHERVEWSYRVGLLRRRLALPPWPWTPDSGITAHEAWDLAGRP